MMAVPTSMVTPSGTSSSLTVPANGEGSSTIDLAVSISHRTSLMATASPGLTFQETISASVSPSPTSGRLNLFRVMVSSVGKGAVQRLEDAVDVRKVVFLHLGNGVGHVEPADADHGCLERMEGALTDPGSYFAADP